MTRTTAAEADQAVVARIHQEWWTANEGLDEVGMTEALAPDFLMWNLNGHPYYSRDELATLISYYKDHLVPDDPPELWDVNVTIGADLAYVSAEGMLPFLVASEEGGQASVVASMGPRYEKRGRIVRFLFRETMVLKRDPDVVDGWSICHFHCSPSAPRDELRPGFGDTSAMRETT